MKLASAASRWTWLLLIPLMLVALSATFVAAQHRNALKSLAVEGPPRQLTGQDDEPRADEAPEEEAPKEVSPEEEPPSEEPPQDEMPEEEPPSDDGPQPTPAAPQEDEPKGDDAPEDESPDDEGPQPTPAAPEDEEPKEGSQPTPAAPQKETPERGDDDAPADAAMEAEPEAAPAQEEPTEAANPDEGDAPAAATPNDELATPEDAEDTPAKQPLPSKLPPNPKSLRSIKSRPSARSSQEIDAATLKGVKPGASTRDELHEAWGPAKRVEKLADGFRETYEVEPFDRVRVTIVDNVVASVAIFLAKAVPLESIAERLEVSDIQPVDIFNDNAELAGKAYPERGVMFGFVPNADALRVFQVIAEPVDAEMFLARAEQRLTRQFSLCMADLSQALQMLPDSPRVQLLHTELALRAGDLDQAHQSAEALLEAQPPQPEYRLAWAKVLAAEGDYVQAARQVRDVVNAGQASGLVLARAYCQWGDYTASGEARDFEESIKHHQQAIKLAEPETLNSKYSVRRAAKELMVEAHLAVAHDIGWGRWQQKPKAVARWIDHARAYADDLLSNEQGSDELRLRLCEGALSAMAGIAQPPDAAKWIIQLKRDGKQLYDQAGDEAYKAHLAWRLGKAFADATEIEAARRRPDAAIELGRIALNYFDQGAEAAEHTPMADQQRGRLLFRLGSVCAIQRSNHKQAIEWFDQAIKLLEAPVPDGAIDQGKLGEAFVSMGVSYWEAADKNEALRLTGQGVKLMETAVYRGSLDKLALAIPYGNLSSMHQQLGDAIEAKRYAELASRHERAK